MRIFITGATGLIGRRLVVDRLERGDRLIVLSRDGERASRLFAAPSNPNITVVEGNPAAPGAWQQRIDGCDAVVHLAGAGIADRRWSSVTRKILVDSRVDSTHQVASAVRQSNLPPRVFISASASGFYGETGADPVDESGPVGRDFLARLALRWEEQARRASSASTRVVVLRIGTVLDERGGILKKLLPVFRAGLGGPWCSGGQYLSWIHWRDLIGLFDLALNLPDAPLVINATSPNPATVRQFAGALGRALRRPALLPAPKTLLRVTHGKIADVMAVSNRVIPRHALDRAYRFLYPTVEEALTSLLTAAPPAARVSAVAAGSRPERDAPSASSALASAPAPAGAVTTNGKLPAPPSPVRLLAIDVDGTLLRSDGRLAQGVIQACRLADRTACVIVLATARPPRGMHSIVRALDLFSPIINYNGAVIWNPLDECPQHHQPLDGELVRQIVQESRALVPELLVGLEAIDDTFTDRVDRRLEQLAGLAIDPDYVGPLEPHYHKPLTRLDLAGSPEQIAPVLDLISQRYWRSRRVALFRSNPHVIQIMHPLVDKSIALQRIARRMNIQRDGVMAIGDAENDLGMMEWAGFSVAVENARPAVKAMADQIVPSNDDQGVARDPAIRHEPMKRCERSLPLLPPKDCSAAIEGKSTAEGRGGARRRL